MNEAKDAVEPFEPHGAPVSSLQDRYPGPRSFADNDVDQRVFFGREQETEHLLHRVRATRLLVLFGKSGLGKTSLLQAGLYPRLRGRGLLPIPVRFDRVDLAPLDAVLGAVEVACQAHGIDFERGTHETLWEFFKTADLWQDDVLVTPVLVLDQFEELFTLRSDHVREALASELGELVAQGLPARNRQRIQAGGKSRYGDSAPEVKVILSLREEYVGALEQLVPNVPGIFEQRFQLTPLDQGRARRAVLEPAALKDPGVFATRPFRYTDAALDEIMNFLANRRGEVEPFQLQIVCRHAEEQVTRREAQGADQVEVDNALLGGRKAMEVLVKNFYQDALKTVPSWPQGSRQRGRARRLCELGLLSADGYRVSKDEGEIRKYKVSDENLEKLSDERLIRKETRPGFEGFYYELSHDSVAKAVADSRRPHLPRWAKISLFFLVPLVIGAVWLAFNQRQAALAARQEAQTTKDSYVSTQQKLVDSGVVIEPEMVAIPAGNFDMGFDMGGVAVRIPRTFQMSRYEVTFEAYDQFTADTKRPLPSDSGWGRGKRPVISISWNDARKYTEWLSQKTGKPYRLPTEAEWEYAARSGGLDQVWSGTSQERELGDYSWYRKNSGFRTRPVGEKKPNDLGLYDMSGNVWEWVEDCWHNNYEGAPENGSAWREEGGGDCGQRVIRGGSWYDSPADLRSSNRGRDYAGGRDTNVGFRLARDLE